jgi:tetratricopeptide (TPR) repeat protein
MRKLVLTVLCCLWLGAPVWLWADGGDSDSAKDTATNPQQTQADYDTGFRHMKAGEYKAAVRAFERVVDVDPKHAMAYTNLAYSYRKLGKYKKAIRLYDQALALQPNLAEAHEYKGEALLALGKIAEAKQHLAILEKLNPELANELREEIARRERS